MEQLQFTQEGYVEIKGKIREKLNETVNNFITIGYYMKQVRDNGLYRQDGYRSMAEFAMQEYKLSESTANRFMDINTMFSMDGNSLEIKEEYRNYGYSKLQEMLTMKEEDFTLVTEDTTVKQIREIKAMEREEDSALKEQGQKELPLVKMAAGEAAADEAPVATSQEPKCTPLEEIATAFWKEQKQELLAKLSAGMLTPQIFAEEICPSGSRTFSCRLCMLLFYDFSQGIKHRYIKDKRPTIDTLSYADFLELSVRLYAEGHLGAEAEPEDTYKPLPGQMRMEDIPEVIPKENEDIAATVEENAEDNVVVEDGTDVAEPEEPKNNTVQANPDRQIERLREEMAELQVSIRRQVATKMYHTALRTTRELAGKLEQIIDLEKR